MSTARWLAMAAGAAVAASAGGADNWSNSGGNAGRNGLTAEIGPDAATVLWSAGRPSIIAWQPVIDGGRVFSVRQSGFPPEPGSNLSPVVGQNLDTGAELWPPIHVPFNTGDWTTFVAGARDGRVYASRSGGGGNVSPFPNGQAKMHAYDATTGMVSWSSVATTCAGPYDGVVFAGNGDLIVGDFLNVTRIRAGDGTTAWRVNRVGSVSGTCGAAVNNAANAVYVADAAAGGTVIKRFDLDTGAFRYQSPVMTGFTIQNTPFVTPDGSVCLSRTQNNAGTDFFYVFDDTGAALTQRWFAPAAWTTTSEFAADAGSVVMVAPGYLIERRRLSDGMVLATSAVVVNDYSQRMAVDALGRLFYSNGEFGVSRFHSFNADLTERWSVPIPNVNIGAPAIGRDGTLVIAGTDVLRAYRTPRPACDANCDQSTTPPVLNVNDFVCFNILFAAGDARANCDASTSPPVLNVNDFTCFLNAFAAGCT
ncbi:MAG: PQQ-like beta-propeller repeat protein [Phycisphaerae bacterium]|nr:PQQ-like beta-propeller repeat protein [Phycisphaerae bacterium]